MRAWPNASCKKNCSHGQASGLSDDTLANAAFDEPCKHSPSAVASVRADGLEFCAVRHPRDIYSQVRSVLAANHKRFLSSAASAAEPGKKEIIVNIEAPHGNPQGRWQAAGEFDGESLSIVILSSLLQRFVHMGQIRCKHCPHLCDVEEAEHSAQVLGVSRAWVMKANALTFAMVQWLPT